MSVTAESSADLASTSSSSRRARRLWGRLRGRGQLAGLITVLLVLATIFQLGNPIFLSASNILEILRASALYFIVACPMTLVLVSGGIDFSAGAIFATGGVAAGLLMVAGVPWPLAVLFGMLVGGVLGVANASAAVFLRVPPLIATLGTFFVASGAIMVITAGNSVYGFPTAFTDLGQGFLLGVPFLVWYAVIIGVIFWVILEKTQLGYDARATGGNRAAASESTAMT